MLKFLSVSNLAIIEHLELEFSGGMSAMTGETGAGKSILIDALNLATGARADLGLIRDGADSCNVAAEFDITTDETVQKWLDEGGFDTSTCLLRRQLKQDGNSRCFINQVPTTVNQLKELGAMLVTIHSQHAQHQLLSPKAQGDLLDEFGAHQQQLKELQQLYSAFVEVHKQKQELESLLEHPDKLELLRFQCEELDAFSPQPDEYEEINQQHRIVSSQEQRLKDAQEALLSLEGEQVNALQLIGKSSKALRNHSDDSPAINNAVKLLDEAQTYIEETCLELSRTITDDEKEFDFDALDQRLTRWHDLARKHHIDVRKLPEFHQELLEKIALMERAADAINTIDSAVFAAQEQWQQVADALSLKRQQAAKKLESEIAHYLSQLAMPNAQLSTEIITSEGLPSPNGKDSITMFLRANPGQKPSPLHKTASGGELSRVALALAVINARSKLQSTLIFDEVDVGIGGAVAEIVGDLLSSLSSNRQVIVITHQAQVASKAKTHFCIYKSGTQATTKTDVRVLSADERIDEIARMIGGVTMTEATRNRAAEMLVEHIEPLT